MSDVVKPLMKSTTSSSGTRPRVVTPAKPALPPDDEFRAFFAQGDAGEYEGGMTQAPASMEPVSVDQSQRVEAGAHRRAFFAKVVGAVIAGCLVLLAVAIGLSPLKTRNTERTRTQADAVAGRANDHLAIQAPPNVASAVVVAAGVPPGAAIGPIPDSSVPIRAEPPVIAEGQPSGSAAETKTSRVGGAAVADVLDESAVAATNAQPPRVSHRLSRGSVTTVRVPNSLRQNSGPRASNRAKNAPVVEITKPSVAAFPVD